MFSNSKNFVISGGVFTNIEGRNSDTGMYPIHRAMVRENDEAKLTYVIAFHNLQEAVAPGAFHNSKDRFDPPKCHPNTRLAILTRIMSWVYREESANIVGAFIMWLYGGAGAGKSAIAQTIAERCEAEHLLLASFFFSRSDASRNSADKLIGTIAYQICLNVPGAREIVERVIERDPLVFKRSIQSQLTLLIVEPLHQIQLETGYFNDPSCLRLVVVDGLDECQNPDVQSNILEAISSVMEQRNLPLLFLITSRPEQQITWTINSNTFTKLHTRLALDDKYQPDHDIWRYLWDSFQRIKQNHRMKAYIDASWPSDDVMQTLVKKASGQFIYAAVVIKYVSSPRHRPTDRLDIILGVRSALRDTPFADLDMLYMHILSGVEDIESTMSIISFIIFRRQIFWGVGNDAERVEQFLDLRPGDVELHLGDLSSVIQYNKAYARIHITHASFQDFLLDSSRSQQFFIDPPFRHMLIARRAFYYLSPKSGSIGK